MVHSLMVFKGFKGQLNLWSKSTSSYFGNPQKSLLGNRPACNAKIVVILGGIRTTQTRYWGSLCPQTRPTLRSLCCKKHMNEAKGLKFLLSYEFHETYRVPEEQACQTMQTLLIFSHLNILTLFPSHAYARFPSLAYFDAQNDPFILQYIHSWRTLQENERSQILPVS